MTKRIFLGLTINFLLLAIFSASTVEIKAQKRPTDEAKKLVKVADQFFKQKDYRNAADKYGEAVKISPNYSYAHFWKGYAHYYLKEFDPAITDLDLAFEQGYKPVLEIYKLRWYLQYEKKNYDAALKDVQEGLKLDPTNNAMMLGLANIYRETGSYQDALDIYKKVSTTDPNNPNIPYFMALAYYKSGDSKSQETAAEEAAKRNSQYVGESYFLLGDARQKNKNVEGAIEAYKRAINVKPDQHDAYVNLTTLYRNQYQLSEAIATTKNALRIFPEDANFYLNLSSYYSLADRPAEAATAAQNAIRLAPNDYLPLMSLCRAFNGTKEYQKAIFACNDALRINPDDGETNFYAGRANELLNKKSDFAKYYEKAIASLTDFTNKNPENSDGFYILGNAYYADNKIDEAIESYKKSLQLAPNFAKARFNLGIMYVSKRDGNSAREQYDALLKINKDMAGRLKQVIDKK